MKKDKPVPKTLKGGMVGPPTSEPRKGTGANSGREPGGKPYTGTEGPSFGGGPIYKGNKPA